MQSWGFGTKSVDPDSSFAGADPLSAFPILRCMFLERFLLRFRPLFWHQCLRGRPPRVMAAVFWHTSYSVLSPYSGTQVTAF